MSVGLHLLAKGGCALLVLFTFFRRVPVLGIDVDVPGAYYAIATAGVAATSSVVVCIRDTQWAARTVSIGHHRMQGRSHLVYGRPGSLLRVELQLCQRQKATCRRQEER